ncbi:hypothetical protein AZ54_24325 [Xanthomonas oryzae pv. oryzae PXO86]|uniref:Site-specific DNA-methyltransferase n=1 Tax=Xanthomonas oryzae pv. oryzae (strain KACC10331 / KXO85) TaxID=291331 RepID=Q5GTV6_XANOR|nr:site-specific DNA-methyltransferase [Xanthomonas oryzae pv. oryzae KACC 10331]AJQ85707.1 hypothetical protein AZ54_24325 [Xanthomonas oryzae pv. oryzae PXO86]
MSVVAAELAGYRWTGVWTHQHYANLARVAAAL